MSVETIENGKNRLAENPNPQMGEKCLVKDVEESKIIQALKKDRNAIAVEDIKTALKDKVITEEDLRSKVEFSNAMINAIKNYNQKNPPRDEGKKEKRLPPCFTEVYFWGLRNTGKTCAIGATLGYLKKSGHIKTTFGGYGEDYLNYLCSVFDINKTIVSLPDRTDLNELPIMPLVFEDKDTQLLHRIAFIDVAGEVFSSIYKKMKKIQISSEEEAAIKAFEKILKNGYNRKIHFFIVEYGDDSEYRFDERDNNPKRKSEVMYELARYFAGENPDGTKRKGGENIFNTSSVSMNILVTKCDRIGEDDTPRKRLKRAQEFVEPTKYKEEMIDKEKRGWEKAVDEINTISCKAHSGYLNAHVFSIGEIYAKKLCVFNPTDAASIVQEIINHTTGFKDNWWQKVKDFFLQ